MDDDFHLWDTEPKDVYVRLRGDANHSYWEHVPGLTDCWEAIRMMGDRFIYFKYEDGIAPVIWAPFGLIR